MEFEKLIRERYSCRKLKDTPIEKEKLGRILEAGIAAPTGCNYQPYKLWVLTGEENCRVMSELTKYTFGEGTFIVVGADPSKAWTRKYDGLNISTIDASIVATHLMLGIHDAGLGSTWVGSFNAPEMKKRYPEMQDYELIAIFPVGEIEEEARPAKLHYERKGISEMVRFDLMPAVDGL